MRRNLRTWVRNLRSHKWVQGKNSLCTVDAATDKAIQHCCLGVAEELNPDVRRRPRTNEYSSALLDSNSPFGRDMSRSTLTASTQKWLGLEHHNPVVKMPNGKWSCLSSLNDSGKYSFQDIADLIEAQPADWNGTMPPGSVMMNWSEVNA